MQSPKRKAPEKARRQSLFKKDLVEVSQEQLTDVSAPDLVDASFADPSQDIQIPRKKVLKKVRKPRPFGGDLLQFSDENDSFVEVTDSSGDEKSTPQTPRTSQTPQRKPPASAKRQLFPGKRSSPRKQTAVATPDDDIFDVEKIPPKIHESPAYKARRKSLFEKDLVEVSQEELDEQKEPLHMQFDLLESSDSNFQDYKFLDDVKKPSSKPATISPSVVTKIKESRRQIAQKERRIQNEKPPAPGPIGFAEELDSILDEINKVFG